MQLLNFKPAIIVTVMSLFTCSVDVDWYPTRPGGETGGSMSFQPDTGNGCRGFCGRVYDSQCLCETASIVASAKHQGSCSVANYFGLNTGSFSRAWLASPRKILPRECI